MTLIALFLILFVTKATNIDEEQPKCSTFQNLTKTPKFIDKSLLIRHILDSPRHIYIAAPPGFGKSTNLQMLKEFFSLEVDSGGNFIDPAKILKSDETFQDALKRCVGDLQNTSTRRGTFVTDTKGQCAYVNVTKPFSVFANPLRSYDTFSKLPLKIHKESPNLFETQFARYPVLLVDFGALSTKSFQDYVRSFQMLVSKLFQQFQYLLKSSALTQGSKDEFLLFHDQEQHKELSIDEVILGGEKLVFLLSAHHDRKSIVLVDNFDVPIRKALLAPHLDEVIFKRIMWSASHFVELLVESKFVFRIVVTGNLRIDITNGLKYLSIFDDEHLYRYYGLTKNDIAQLARRFNKQEHISNVRSWYGGYKVTRKGHCLYNTRSTLRYFETGEFEPYRDESNKLKTLKKVLSYTRAGRYVEDSFEDNTTLVIREKIEYGHFEDLRLTIFNPNRTLDERDLVLQILFDHGFFTMGNRNKLKVPNIEAMHDIKSLIFDRTYYISKLKITKEIVRAFVRSIEGLSGEDGPFHDFSRAVIELFRGQVPRSAREMAHALVFIAADARKFSQVRGEETPDGTRQDVLVKRSEEMGIVIGIMVGSVNDEALKPVFTKSLHVFHGCRVKVAVLLGLKPGEKGGDLEVLFTEILPSENQSVVERSEHLHHEAHVNHGAMTRKEKIVIGHVVASSTLSSTAKFNQSQTVKP